MTGIQILDIRFFVLLAVLLSNCNMITAQRLFFVIISCLYSAEMGL